MSTKEQWGILAIVAVGCLALCFYLVPSPYERHYSQLTSAKMIGLTKAQVLDRVGKPHSILEEDHVWSFQIGKDPGAVLLFTDGKVTEVSEWER